jgi:hypothetical protein
VDQPSRNAISDVLHDVAVGTSLSAERYASGAPGSGSGADAVGGQVQCLVRLGVRRWATEHMAPSLGTEIIVVLPDALATSLHTCPPTLT